MPENLQTAADDVEHDPKAEREAVERMHAQGTGSDHEDDPTHDHDPEALKEAKERMAADD